MQKGATCYLAGKMGRRKGPGIPPETDGHCQEKVRRDPVPNKPLPKGSWGKPWRTEVCLSPVLVDRLHKPHIIKTWIQEPGKRQMFTGRLFQIPMLNLLLKDMETCRGIKPFCRCQKAMLSCFPDSDNGEAKKKNKRKRFSYICFQKYVILNGVTFSPFYGQIASLFLQFCQKNIYGKRGAEPNDLKDPTPSTY